MYCHDCRMERDNIGVSIPIEMVDEDLFVDLYVRGFTASDPDIAAEIVFGEASPGLVERLNAVLGGSADGRY